jgi:hypothetical protein
VWGSMDKPKVYLGMPQYGGMAHLGAVYSALRWATEGAVDVVDFRDCGSSLLPHTFNGLFCQAMTLRDRGECTHFAMLHSDIHTASGWVDSLLEQMRSYKAAVISAVVPIKDQDADKTSTAIAPRSDPWAVRQFIRVADKPDMPVTFGTPEACKNDDLLLINTGCMLADLRMPFWDDFAFQFKTRKVHKDGQWLAQVQPEDWIMSRELDAAGVRYAATWAVQLIHYGEAGWRNGWTP